VRAALWWEGLIRRHTGRDVQFQAEGPAQDLQLPAELFDSVADNLIDNALHKVGVSAGLQVRVTLSAAHGGTLTVCDNGAAVPKNLADQLFDAPVASQTGLGVGLYHSARQATPLGYRLALTVNEEGTVCFVLAREAGAT
jgi:sensor histidine kinase regulating citrate/malate metabolism